MNSTLRKLPHLILETLAQGPDHGYCIAQDIKRIAPGVIDMKEGLLYPALHDLENRGYLTSYEHPERGRMRRFYRITEKGRRVVVKQREKAMAGARAPRLVPAREEA